MRIFKGVKSFFGLLSLLNFRKIALKQADKATKA